MKLLSLKCCLCPSRSFSCDHLLTRTPPHFALPILTSACNRYHDIFHTKIFSNEKITDRQIIIFVIEHAWILKIMIARSSWLNCATLRDYEAEYWVSIGHFEAVAVGNWWYWVSRGHLCLYILHTVEIWTGDTYFWRTDGQTLKDSATQLQEWSSHNAMSHWYKLTQFTVQKRRFLKFIVEMWAKPTCY